MKSPTTIKEVQIINGCLATLNRFLNRSTDKYKPFFFAIKKNGVDFYWNNECEAAFQGLMAYLASPPLLSKLFPGNTLFLCLVVSTITVRAVLIREDEGTQKSVYYVSKALVDAQTRYMRIEKLVLALFITIRKLKHYFQSFPVIMLTEYRLRTIVENSEASGKIGKWVKEITPLGVTFESRTSIKG